MLKTTVYVEYFIENFLFIMHKLRWGCLGIILLKNRKSFYLLFILKNGVDVKEYFGYTISRKSEERWLDPVLDCWTVSSLEAGFTYP